MNVLFSLLACDVGGGSVSVEGQGVLVREECDTEGKVVPYKRLKARMASDVQ